MDSIHPEETYCFLIGIEKYNNSEQWHDLPAAQNNAEDLRRVLIRNCNYSPQ